MRTPDERHDRLQRLAESTRAELRRWTDAPDHDPGISLVELFAFLGDTLSAYAEAIGAESFLGSRRRVADPRVTIDGEAWERVKSLAESRPDDPHYAVTVDQDGATVIEFGDGVHGRRPPGGGEMRVTYRSGRRFASVVVQAGRVVLDSDWNERAAPPACGIHRAVVVQAVDPLGTGRLLVHVPSILGDEHHWALPCLPPGSTKLPPAGAAVWVAFEACDPERPVWLGRATYP